MALRTTLLLIFALLCLAETTNIRAFSVSNLHVLVVDEAELALWSL